MDTFFYILIFIIGTLFGSFFTLAIHRIPKKQDILYTHSYCPNCNHKLGFLELIPIISYIGLKGKCAHCGQKIRMRYLILEILSGLVFLLFALSINLNPYNIEISTVIRFFFYSLYFVTLFIIAGIDKEKNIIEKSVLLFGTVLAICFMIYICISIKAVIYTYIIKSSIIALLLMIDIIFLKRKFTENYGINALILGMIMLTFSSGEVFYYTIFLTLILIGVKLSIIKIKENKEDRKKGAIKELDIPLAYYMCISNILLIIISNLILLI